MNAIKRAIEAAGGPARVAASLGVTVQAVCFWRDGSRRMPAEYMAALEQLGEGAVPRWELRPNDWHRIWPELIGQEGAPAVPVVAED